MIVPLPPGLTVDDQGSVFAIKRKWFSVTHVIMLIFSLFWNAFLVFWYSISISMFTQDAPGPPAAFSILFLVFPLIHVGVGLYLFYFGISGLVNTTRIEVGSGQLSIKHGPLPWPGNLVIETAQLKQLYCTEKYSHSKSGTSVSYTVNVVLATNKMVPLVKNLPEKDQALYIEKIIESRLGITDEPVAGALNN
jgi:hypothetical protein